MCLCEIPQDFSLLNKYYRKYLRLETEPGGQDYLSHEIKILLHCFFYELFPKFGPESLKSDCKQSGKYSGYSASSTMF